MIFRYLTVLAIAASIPLRAGEFAVLTSGFRLHLDRHEADGCSVRLYIKDGVIELNSGQVAAFEAEEPLSAPQTAAAVAPVPPATERLTPRELVDRAADTQGLSDERARALLHSVARVESGYRADAVSPKGATGIMQLMPATAAALSADPRDPAQNVNAGALYLRQLLLKYQDQPNQVRLALAAYNAGPGAVDRYHGIPPYRETILYVDKVLRQFHKLENPPVH